MRALSALVVSCCVAACVDPGPEDAGPFDAGAPFVAKCQVLPKSGISCTDGGTCPFSFGAELDCGVSSTAVVAAAAEDAGRAHALFSISDNQNRWHTQWATLERSATSAEVKTDVLAPITSTINPRLGLAAAAAQPPLAFFHETSNGGVQALQLGDAGAAIETVAPRDAGNGGLVDWEYGFALVNSTDGIRLFSRAANGTWSPEQVGGTTSFPSSLALTPSGAASVAYWVFTSSSNEPEELHVKAAGGADTVLRREPLRGTPHSTELAIGTDDAGADVPVVVYQYEGTFVVAPGAADGGYLKTRVPEPGVASTCPVGVLHVTCDECPNPTCTLRGDSIQELAVTRAPDGSVFLAAIWRKTDIDRKVTAKPTTFGGVVINCDCDVETTRDGSRTTELVLWRITPGSPATLERKLGMSLPTRARDLTFTQTSGEFHLSFTDSTAADRRPVMHHVVLDAAPLL